MIGGSNPPPAVFVDADDLDFLSAGELNSVVSGSWVVVCDCCVVPWSTWCLGGGGGTHDTVSSIKFSRRSKATITWMAWYICLNCLSSSAYTYLDKLYIHGVA